MKRIAILMAIGLIATGCQNESDRVAELASRHATQQSELSRETVELQTELVKGTHELVVADARARRDFMEQVEKLDEQRAEVARWHEDLEDERRQIAKQRFRDPIVANAVTVIGTLLACLLPLIVAAYLLRLHLSEPDNHAVTELLLEEVAATHPALAEPVHSAIDRCSNVSAPRISSGLDEPPSDDSNPSTNQLNE